MPSFIALAEQANPVEKLDIPVSDVVGYLGNAVDFITGNEITMLFLAGAVISMALGMFGKAKRVVRR